ncbi:MAG: c-type cytochrome [Acidobacteriaceae bacterium]
MAASIRARAQTPEHAKTNPMEAPDVQRGNALFQQSCSLCHGAGATGGAGPNLLQSGLLLNRKYFGDELSVVIQGGRPDRGMPAFPMLSADNISDIIAFLNARVEVTSSESSGSADSALKQLLTGNAAAGKRYFDGEGKCATCHSPTGDLAGIAKKYPPDELQAMFLYPRDNKVTATVLLPSGKKIKGTLLHHDAFYVAIRDEDGWYRSWPLQDVKVQVEDPLSAHEELLHSYKNKDVHDVFSYLETLK